MRCGVVPKPAAGKVGWDRPLGRESLEEYVKLFQATDDDEFALFDGPPAGRRG
jgi:hypothetical protein